MEKRMDLLCEALRGRGWTVKVRSVPAHSLPECVRERYDGLPAAWMDFQSMVSCCMSADQTKWLLCLDDFGKQEDDAFRWNEFELMSLQAAKDAEDAGWEQSIRAFWDCHLPIAFSVGGEYEYYALRTTDGHIVHGVGPEFEETEETAASFLEFAERIGAGEALL